MTLEHAISEYLTRPDMTVAEIAKAHSVGLETIYAELHRRRHANQGGTLLRREMISALDRRVANLYEKGVAVRTIKEILQVGAGRVYRVVRLLGLERRR